MILNPMYEFKVSSVTMTKKRVGEEIWGSTFKFAFVRNPWDRYVSNWHWLTRKEKNSVKGWKFRGWKGQDGSVSFKEYVHQIGKYLSNGYSGIST